MRLTPLFLRLSLGTGGFVKKPLSVLAETLPEPGRDLLPREPRNEGRDDERDEGVDISVYLNLLNLPPAQIRNLFVLRPVSQARFRISQAPNGNFISNSAFFSAAFSSGSAFAGST